MTKKRYKVMGDTKNTFLDIELDLVLETEEIGSTVNVLGGTFVLTQNGKILVLVEKDWCLTLMDVTPVEEKVSPKLIINDTLEIYLETKEIAVKCKCTYEELFYALQNEWKMISTMTGTAIPFDYTERLKLFTFNNEWGFENGNFSMMQEGSFTRFNSDGRSL